MSMSTRLLERGTRLWRSGRRIEAQNIFKTIINIDRSNEAAWNCYIHTLQTSEEKQAALEEFLTIFPDNPSGKEVLENLKAEAGQKRVYSAIPAAIGQPKMRSAERSKPAPIPAASPVQKSRPIPLPWILVVLGLCLLLASSARFIQSYGSLQAENHRLVTRNEQISQNLASLNNDYLALQSDHGLLVNEYNSLTGKHSLLTDQYNSLSGEYSRLLGNYNTLSGEHAALQNSYNTLLTEYNYTVQSYTAYREISIAPPYIYTKGRKVHLVFMKLDGSLLRWEIDSDWLEYHLRRGDELRDDLDYDLSLYNSLTDETYHVVDDRDFVDSTPFSNWMSDLYYQSPDDATFLKEAWNIVAQLTAYTSEMGETPRFPMETLLSGGGDCEDHAILFASMILAAPVDWEVKFVYMDQEHPSQPQTMNHVIVQVTTPHGPHLIEATSKYMMEPYGGSLVGWAYTIK